MYRVLIADDEPIERLVVSKIINKYFSGQLEVVQAVNGREAVTLFETEQCHIALLDIEMPGINGLEAAEQIRKIHRDCSIIFLTAFDEFSYARRAITVRALDYLLKPGSEEELVAVLEEAVRLTMEAESREGQRKAVDRGNCEDSGSREENRNREDSGNREENGNREDSGNCEDSGSREENRNREDSGSHEENGNREDSGSHEENGNREDSRNHSEDIGAESAGQDTSGYHDRGEREESAERLRINAVTNRIRAFVEEHYCEDIALQDVAAELNYSDAYFCKLFKQCFDRSFVTYLTALRVDRAKDMLDNVAVNIKDISNRVGYRDSNYFAKVFKRMAGVTPSEYRSLKLQEKNKAQ